MAWSPFFPGFPANPKDQSQKTPLQILNFVIFFLKESIFYCAGMAWTGDVQTAEIPSELLQCSVHLIQRETWNFSLV